MATITKINIPSVNDKLLDKYIRHSVWMEQLKAGEAAAISKMLKKDVFPQLYDRLVAELGKVKNLKTVGSIRKIKRIKQMMASVEQTATAGAIRAGKLINKKMYNVARFEAKWNKTILEKAVPLDISLNVPSNAVLKQLVLSSTFEGHRMQTWIKGYSRSVQAGIAKQLKAGVATGENLPTIAKRLRKVLGQKSRQAETLARTAVSNIVHDAREATFKANKKLIRKVQMVATLDDKTTLICINYDGKVFNVGEGDRPPFHFNCRTTTVPVVTSWNEYGITDPPAFTRASMNGAVPAKMNYRQWLKRQSKSTQIKVLGKKRQALYASGKVKIDRFVSKDFKSLTLKQLARREGLSFKKVMKVRAKVTAQPAPPSVKAMPMKASGIKFTENDGYTISRWTYETDSNILNAQLGRKLDPLYELNTKVEALREAIKLENALKKLDGFDGTTYRGLAFKNDKLRSKFLSKFETGKVWKSKSFQATSKNKSTADLFATSDPTRPKSVKINIKGKSGRFIEKFGDEMGEEAEVLFMKNTPFKVTKIKGNEVWLEEVTKQAQLKVVPAPPKVVSKVGTTFVKTTDKEIRDLVSKQINTYPENVKAALNRNDVHYNIGNSITEINPVLKGRHPVGWSTGSTWDNVSGMYNINTKSISIAETYRPVGSKIYVVNSKGQIRRILNHETGHAFDSSISGTYSNSSKFKASYAKDIAKLSKADIVNNNLRFFMQKGVNGRSETFADLFGDIVGGGARPRLKKFFPNSTKYIDDILK